MEWNKYKASTKYHGLIYTKECSITEEEVDRELANLNKTQTKITLREQFTIWEVGAAFWSKYAQDTHTLSEGGVQAIQKGKLLLASSKA